MANTQRMDIGVRDEMRTFIEDNFLYMRPDLKLEDTDQLLELGVLDSLGFLELVEEVHARYGISAQDVEITEDNFGSVNALVRFIGEKRTE